MPQLALAHIHEDELTLYLTGHLLSDRAADVQAHLCECGLCKQRLDDTLHFITELAGIKRRQPAPSGTERRSEPRFACDTQTSVQILRPLSFNRLRGRVVNASKSGVALRLPAALDRGSLVQVRVGTMVMLGEIRYCDKTDQEFTLGVRLEDVAVP